ncbi:MAG: ABC transporter substrate-binding protein [Meiothermus sp.]|nr:ABC transporter substrate-binding protein [Meiothermus sp.]
MRRALWTMVAGLVLASGLGVAQQARGDADAEKFRADFLAGRLTWNDVLAQARKEGQVNWFHWGGSNSLNTWIDQVVKPEMAKVGVNLRTTRITDTKNAVDLVVADNAAGKGLGRGTVDLIWINGENFYTLSTQNLLFGGFADKLPNSKNFFFDPRDPRSRLNLTDFGHPTGLAEIPWSGDQYICHVDTARLRAADAPQTVAQLEAWLRRSPGRFTYVKPPHFNGNTFLNQIMYATNPDGHEPFQKRANQLGVENFIKATKSGYEFLKRIEPFLLGGGGREGVRGNPIYPVDQNALQTLLVNGQVDMACRFGKYHAAVEIQQGRLPRTVQNVIFPREGMISNKNYVVIPSNSPSPAAALVLANVLASVENQVSKLQQIGYVMGIDSGRLTAAEREMAAKAAPPLPGPTLEQLNDNAVPDTNASLVTVIEGVWLEYIERQSNKPLEQIIREVWAARIK